MLKIFWDSRQSLIWVSVKSKTNYLLPTHNSTDQKEGMAQGKMETKQDKYQISTKLKMLLTVRHLLSPLFWWFLRKYSYACHWYSNYPALIDLGKLRMLNCWNLRHTPTAIPSTERKEQLMSQEACAKTARWVGDWNYTRLSTVAATRDKLPCSHQKSVF